MDFILLYSVLQHAVLVIDDIRVEFRFNHRLLNCAVQLGATVGGTSLFLKSKQCQQLVKNSFSGQYLLVGGKRQHPPLANKDKSKNVFHTIHFVVGFQGFSLPRRLYGYSVQQCVCPLRESFLRMYTWGTWTGRH